MTGGEILCLLNRMTDISDTSDRYTLGYLKRIQEAEFNDTNTFDWFLSDRNSLERDLGPQPSESLISSRYISFFK